MRDDQCASEFAQHPTQPHLIAVCVLPKGHDGGCDNRLPKGPTARPSSGPESTEGYSGGPSEVQPGWKYSDHARQEEQR